jgi:hypothetical protein
MSEVPRGEQPAWRPAGDPASAEQSRQPPSAPLAMPRADMEPHVPNEPVLVAIGDISVTQSRVFTPSGSRPVNEVLWTFNDMSQTSEVIPTWAVVCAIVFFVLCLVGLLFLLVKETRTKGSVQVTVHSPGFVHTTQIPVYSPANIADISGRVDYARTLSASMQHGRSQQPGSWPQRSQGQEPTQGL